MPAPGPDHLYPSLSEIVSFQTESRGILPASCALFTSFWRRSFQPSSATFRSVPRNQLWSLSVRGRSNSTTQVYPPKWPKGQRPTQASAPGLFGRNAASQRLTCTTLTVSKASKALFICAAEASQGISGVTACLWSVSMGWMPS